MIVRENFMGTLTANEYQRLSRRTQNENLSCEDTFDLDLEEVLVYNIEKLRRRYPEGFDPVLSEKRHGG